MLLYYFPQKSCNDITKEYLTELNLKHLSEVELGNAVVLNNGPDGGPGCIKAIVNQTYYKTPKMACCKQIQRWIECEGFWLGYYLENKPTPDGLLKRNGTGFFCKTEIGEFLISPQRFMPSKVKLNSQGEIEYIPKEECNVAISLIDKVFSNTNAREVTSDHFKLAAAAISLNYYIGLPECNALEIFDADSIFRIIEAVTDMKAILAISEYLSDKKKELSIEDTQLTEGGEQVN